MMLMLQKGMESWRTIPFLLDRNPKIQKISFSIFESRDPWGINLHLKKAPLEWKLFHNPNRQSTELERKDISLEAIGKLLSDLSPGEHLGLDSKVEMDNGEFYHIPMVDFRQNVSLKTIHEIIDVPGLIFKSGRSFHFWGADVIPEHPEWQIFLGRMLLAVPLVDERYIGHRMIDGFSTLRLSSNKRKPTVPYLVDTVGISGLEMLSLTR